MRGLGHEDRRTLHVVCVCMYIYIYIYIFIYLFIYVIIIVITNDSIVYTNNINVIIVIIRTHCVTSCSIVLEYATLGADTWRKRASRAKTQ